MGERGARDTKVTGSFFEELPIIGHFRAITHYLFNETEMAANAFKSATHNTVVGCLGMFAGILVRSTNITVAEILASIGGSIIGGIYIDSYISVLTSSPYGYFSMPEKKEKRFTAAHLLTLLHLMFKDGMIGSSTFLCNMAMPNWMTNDPEMKNAVIVQEVVLCVREVFEFGRTKRIEDVKDLQMGDHIKFIRYYVYSHHAIVTSVTNCAERSDSYFTVIHFTGNGKSGAKIKDGKYTIKDCQLAYKIPYTGGRLLPDLKRYPNKVTVAIAKYYRDNGTFGEYSFFYNNCEHFAMTCCTGVTVCFQKIKIPFSGLRDLKQLIKYKENSRYFAVLDKNGRVDKKILI